MDAPKKPGEPGELMARLLAEYEERFKHGDRVALFEAIDLAFRTGTNPPLEVRLEFIRCWESWLRYEAETLEEAFGIRRTKGARRGDRARRIRLAWPVLFRVEERHRAGEPIDRELFTAVAKELNISRRTCERIYAAYPSARKLLRTARSLKST